MANLKWSLNSSAPKRYNKTLAISQHTEQYIVEALRAANGLAVSLVAEMSGRVVGQHVLEGVPPEVFFALSFDGHVPAGTVTFHEAFNADVSR